MVLRKKIHVFKDQLFLRFYFFEKGKHTIVSKFRRLVTLCLREYSCYHNQCNVHSSYHLVIIWPMTMHQWLDSTSFIEQLPESTYVRIVALEIRDRSFNHHQCTSRIFSQPIWEYFCQTTRWFINTLIHSITLAEIVRRGR